MTKIAGKSNKSAEKKVLVHRRGVKVNAIYSNICSGLKPTAPAAFKLATPRFSAAATFPTVMK